MNIFFQGPKNQIGAFCISAHGFHNICLLFVDKILN